MVVANQAKRWQAAGTKSSALSDAELKKLIGALCREISRDRDACFSHENFRKFSLIQVTIPPKA